LFYEKTKKKHVGHAQVLMLLNGDIEMGNNVSNVQVVEFYLLILTNRFVQKINSYGLRNGL